MEGGTPLSDIRRKMTNSTNIFYICHADSTRTRVEQTKQKDSGNPHNELRYSKLSSFSILSVAATPGNPYSAKSAAVFSTSISFPSFSSLQHTLQCHRRLIEKSGSHYANYPNISSPPFQLKQLKTLGAAAIGACPTHSPQIFNEVSLLR